MTKYSINHLKNTFKSKWSFMRILRLCLAVVISVEAFKKFDILLGLLGAVLFFQSILNVGCCGSGGCDIDHMQSKGKSSANDVKDVTFEEIK